MTEMKIIGINRKNLSQSMAQCMTGTFSKSPYGQQDENFDLNIFLSVNKNLTALDAVKMSHAHGLGLQAALMFGCDALTVNGPITEKMLENDLLYVLQKTMKCLKRIENGDYPCTGFVRQAVYESQEVDLRQGYVLDGYVGSGTRSWFRNGTLMDYRQDNVKISLFPWQPVVNWNILALLPQYGDIYGMNSVLKKCLHELDGVQWIAENFLQDERRMLRFDFVLPLTS